MYLNYVFYVIILGNDVLCMLLESKTSKTTIGKDNYTYKKELAEHTMVTDSEIFPYVCAIMKKSTYISAGALIDQNWILTAGDALFLLRETAREIRVRLGSINYRKGGVLLPIKLFEIHPFFSDKNPEFDIALVKLAKPIRFTPSLNPIRVQRKGREITATHFIVTSWPVPTEKISAELQHVVSMETIKRRRILTVSHLHPSDFEQCSMELEALEVNSTHTLMCLDPPPNNDPCARDIGAPVVLNGILWGIISSYKPEDCEVVDAGPSFVSLVSAADISSWIHANVRGHRWTKTPYRVVVEHESEEVNDYDNDYDDDEDKR